MRARASLETTLTTQHVEDDHWKCFDVSRKPVSGKSPAAHDGGAPDLRDEYREP